jgi:hypothetical protein
LGSSLLPAELARKDSGVFTEMKHLFSIAPKDGKGGEVMEVFLTEKHSSNASPVSSLTSASGVLSAEARVGERASDAALVRQ